MIDFRDDRGTWGFAVGWAVFILALDIILGYGFVEAVRSESFETTPGVVTKSEVRGGRKGSARYDLAYTYTVNGQKYTGTNYHVQPQFVGNGYWFAARDAHPVGTPVTVRYDPADPGNAYLVPGLRSDAPFVVWGLAPFNLLMIALLWCGWWWLPGTRWFDPALSRCVRKVSGGWIAHPTPDSRFLPRAFLGLGGVAAFGFFVAMACAIVLPAPPPWWVHLLPLALAIVAPVMFGISESRRRALHIDEEEATITFTFKKEPVTWPLSGVLGIDVSVQTRNGRSGPYEVHAVALRWRDAFEDEQQTVLAEYASGEDAWALAAWLTARLDLPSAAPVAA